MSPPVITVPVGDDGAGPRVWWRELAFPLAGVPQVLIGRWRAAARGEGRVEFDEVRTLTGLLPDEPAAIRVFNDQGEAAALWLDFDPNRVGGAAAVQRDADAAAELLRRHGARVIVDVTARGGRHVIAPLAAPAGIVLLRPVVRALAALYPTLDVTPMLNVARGCMAPPGALTRRGERRQLLTALEEARTAVRVRSAAGLLDALRGELAPVDAGVAAAVRVDDQAVAVPGGPRPLPALVRGIVERGIFPTDRYPSGSEARLGALASAACRGWSLAAVQARIAAGEWPGLVTLYGKYGQGWQRRLTADWVKALAYAVARPRRLTPGPQIHTSGKPQVTRGGAPGSTRRLVTSLARDEHRFLRRVYATLNLTATVWARDEAGRTRLAVLLAAVVHAQRTASRIISPGCRSLAVSAGLVDHSTVAAVLRAERDDPDGWVRLVETGTADRPDRYEIVLPARYGTVWDGRPLPTGPLDAVHPIFAAGLLGPGVGMAAWSVERAVAGGAGSVGQVVTATGLSESQVKRCLRALAAVRLVARRVDGRLRRTRRGLDTAGADVGLVDQLAARRQHYEIERRLWRVWLAERGRHDWHTLGYQLVSAGTAVPDDLPPLWLPDWEHHAPPTDADGLSPAENAVALLDAAFDVELLTVA